MSLNLQNGCTRLYSISSDKGFLIPTALTVLDVIQPFICCHSPVLNFNLQLSKLRFLLNQLFSFSPSVNFHCTLCFNPLLVVHITDSFSHSVDSLYKIGNVNFDVIDDTDFFFNGLRFFFFTLFKKSFPTLFLQRHSPTLFYNSFSFAFYFQIFISIGDYFCMMLRCKFGGVFSKYFANFHNPDN